MTPKRNAPSNGSDPESQHRMHVQETSKAIAEASSARWVPASIVEATTDAILCPVPMNPRSDRTTLNALHYRYPELGRRWEETRHRPNRNDPDNVRTNVLALTVPGETACLVIYVPVDDQNPTRASEAMLQAATYAHASKLRTVALATSNTWSDKNDPNAIMAMKEWGLSGPQAVAAIQRMQAEHGIQTFLHDA